MIIKNINILNFGKLSDLKITPSENFNIIFAPNETGKTTLLEFVKFVFYGTRQKKMKNDLTFKEKYMPWNGMPMSGSIEFESGGKNYIIYRSEGAKNGSKILDVKNADTGERYADVENPGEYFFCVDEKVFSDTFFAHDFSALFEPDDNISSAVYGKNETDSSYNRVKHIIEEEILDLTSPKRAGSGFSLINKEISNVKEEKLDIEKEIEEVDCKISELCMEKETLKKQSEILKREYSAARNKKSRMKITEISEMKKRELENLTELKLQLENLEKGGYTKNRERKNDKSIYVKIAFSIVSLAFFWCGITFESMVYVYIALLCAFISFFAFKKKRKTSFNEELFNTITKQIEMCEKRIWEYENKIPVEQWQSNEMSQSDETNIFTNKEIDDIINKMQKCEIDVNVKNSQIHSLHEKKNDLIFQREFCIQRIKEFDLKLEKLKEKQDLYNTALYILDSAFSHLKDYYAPKISVKAFEIFKKVCKEEYASLVADDNFEISLNFGNELKSIKSFSRSTKDAAGLSIRMAICDSISKDNPLPMFFDDVLSSFDDERCFDMMECMKNISADRQIFLCTCRLRETKLRTDCADVEVIRL